MATNNVRYYKTTKEPDIFTRIVGNKIYEINDHLGNVRATVSDRRLGENADLRSSVMYYPFGMSIANRTHSLNYRFGFNGKENDNEVNGNGRFQDYGFRSYMTDIARFASVDPLKGKFPMLSTFQYASLNPIMNIDLDGLEGVASIKGVTKSVSSSITPTLSIAPMVKHYMIVIPSDDEIKANLYNMVSYVSGTWFVTVDNDLGSAIRKAKNANPRGKYSLGVLGLHGSGAGTLWLANSSSKYGDVGMISVANLEKYPNSKNEKLTKLIDQYKEAGNLISTDGTLITSSCLTSEGDKGEKFMKASNVIWGNRFDFYFSSDFTKPNIWNGNPDINGNLINTDIIQRGFRRWDHTNKQTTYLKDTKENTGDIRLNQDGFNIKKEKN